MRHMLIAVHYDKNGNNCGEYLVCSEYNEILDRNLETLREAFEVEEGDIIRIERSSSERNRN